MTIINTKKKQTKGTIIYNENNKYTHVKKLCNNDKISGNL